MQVQPGDIVGAAITADCSASTDTVHATLATGNIGVACAAMLVTLAAVGFPYID
jgi:hypothetical protein